MSTQHPTESRADPTALNEFINSLQRLFKIGIYYPSGHAILDQATDRFMAQLVSIAGSNSTVKLEDYGQSLMLEGIELDYNQPFVQEFKKMLAALDITALIIDREISRAELHVFIRKMLAYRSQVLSAKQFTRIDVAELPHSITVKLKEFLAQKNASISDERAGEATENLDSFVESLAQYGLSGEEISECRTLLESLPERLKKGDLDMQDLPPTSWDDVARLLSRAIKAGKQPDGELRQQLGTHSHINALASILQKLERESPDKSSRKAINLLVSIIKRPGGEDGTESAAKQDLGYRVFPDKPALSISQLQQYAARNRLHPKILATIPESTSHNETLSIMMQLARNEQTTQSQIRMQQLFREILALPIQEKTWVILTHGLLAVVHDGNLPLISSLIRLMVEPLRRSRHASSLHLFALTIPLCDERDARTLWPFEVNEILVTGGGADPVAYHKLCRFAARLPIEEMAALLPRLRSLDAFMNATIAPDIFHSLTPSCYPLFAFLLKTEIEKYIGERVIGGLRRNPADWLIKALVPLLDLSRDDHKLFLYSYLRQSSRKVLSAALKEVAARMVAECLPTLPQERRDESWVRETIAALAQLPYPETRAVLEQIGREKKLLFIPEWPAECRKAAEQALAAIGRVR